MSMSNYNSAIRDADGNVDFGYMGGTWFTFTAIIAIVAMGAGLFVQQYYDQQHRFEALLFGQGAGLVASAYAALTLAIGGFKRLDRPSSNMVTSTASVTAPASPAPAPVAEITQGKP